MYSCLLILWDYCNTDIFFVELDSKLNVFNPWSLHRIKIKGKKRGKSLCRNLYNSRFFGDSDQS